MSTIEDVERLSQRLRDTYMTLRRLAQPRYRGNPDDEKHWKHLAKQVIAHNLDGGHYIRWIYDFYTTLRPMTYPRQIASPKSVQIYMQKASYRPADRMRDLQVKIDVQFEIVRQRAALGTTLPAILADTSLEIGAVVRYVLAHNGGYADLASGFRAEAERAIGFEPLYKQILGDKLPLGEG
jgi:hypothetical protein